MSIQAFCSWAQKPHLSSDQYIQSLVKVYLSPGLSWLCLYLATNPIYPDLWTNFLAGPWTYLVNMNLPGDHWPVSDPAYCCHTQTWFTDSHTWLDHGPASSSWPCPAPGWLWPWFLGLSCLPHPGAVGLDPVRWGFYPDSLTVTAGCSPAPAPVFQQCKAALCCLHKQLRELIQCKSFYLCVAAESEP